LVDVKEEVLKVFGSKLKQLILYGSYARNEQDPESDIDIMALVDDTESTIRKATYPIANIMTQMSLKYDVFVSITEETCHRYNEYRDVLPYFQNIYNEGIEIYGPATV
jgi:uncharacterized protein